MERDAGAITALGMTAQDNLTQLRLSHVLMAWNAWAVRARQLRLAAGWLAPVGRRWRLTSAWSSWCSAVEVSQGLRSEELRALVLLRACFRVLGMYQHHHALRSLLQCQIQETVCNNLSQTLLLLWRDKAALRRHNALRAKLAGHWYAERLVHASWQGWCQAVVRGQHKAELNDQAYRHRRRKLLHKALGAWRANFSWRMLKREVSELARKSHMGSAFSAWKEVACAAAHKEEQRRASVRHRYLFLLSAGLRAFEFYANHKAEKRSLYKRMAKHHQRSLLRLALVGWAQQFLPAAAEARAACARACLLWRQRLLGKAVQGWKAEARRLADKRTRNARAVAWAHSNAAARALVQWMEGIECQRQRHADKACVLAGAKTQLGRHKLRRMMAAWHEVHVGWLVKALKIASAKSHAQTRLCSRALDAWKDWCHKRRTEHAANARAAHFWSSRREAAVFSEMRAYAKHRTTKRAAQECADAKHRTSVTTRALAALSWYRDVRKSKAADQAEARAMYHTRLLREGAVQWLRVGMWRHQHRLQSLAERQAATMAADLMRVAPYAALWRRVVAARRADMSRATRTRGSVLPTTIFTTDAATAARMRGSPYTSSANDPKVAGLGLGGAQWRGGMLQQYRDATASKQKQQQQQQQQQVYPTAQKQQQPFRYHPAAPAHPTASTPSHSAAALHNHSQPRPQQNPPLSHSPPSHPPIVLYPPSPHPKDTQTPPAPHPARDAAAALSPASINATFFPHTGTHAPLEGFDWESALASMLPHSQPASDPCGVSASWHGLPSHSSGGDDCRQPTLGTLGGASLSSYQSQAQHGEPQEGLLGSDPSSQGNPTHFFPSPEQISPVSQAQPSSSALTPSATTGSFLLPTQHTQSNALLPSLPSSSPPFLAGSLHRFPLMAAATNTQPGAARAAAHALLEVDDRRRLAQQQQRHMQRLQKQAQQQQQQQQQQSLPGAPLGGHAVAQEHQPELGQGQPLVVEPSVGEGRLWHELHQMRAHVLEQQRQQQQQQQQQNRLAHPPSSLTHQQHVQGLGISSHRNPTTPSLQSSSWTPMAMSGQLSADGGPPAAVALAPKQRPPPRMPEFLRRKHAS